MFSVAKQSRNRSTSGRRPPVRLALADRFTTLVIGLQLAVLLTFWVTPQPLPPRITLLEMMWASAQRPTFYPLVALLTAGPALTVLAWAQRGLHRPILIISWAAFTWVAVVLHADRLALMLRILITYF